MCSIETHFLSYKPHLTGSWQLISNKKADPKWVGFLGLGSNRGAPQGMEGLKEGVRRFQKPRFRP